MIKKLIDEIKNDGIISFLKDYLSIIIFIPTVLGGLKQFVIISSISPFLISKCFSVTQLIIDGVLTILSIPMLLLGIFNYISITEISKKGGVLFLLTLASLCILFLSLFYFNNNTYNFFQVLSYTIGNILVLLCFIYQKKDLRTRKLKIIYLLFLATIFSIFIDRILSVLENENGIVNFSNIKKELGKQYDNITYLYTNDKYMIYRVTPKNNDKTSYIILEFQDLFKYNNLKIIDDKN